jgi:hypothetical protein
MSTQTFLNRLFWLLVIALIGGGLAAAYHFFGAAPFVAAWGFAVTAVEYLKNTPEWLQTIAAVIGSPLFGVCLYLFGVTPFMRDSLTYDPNNDKGLTLFYRVGSGRFGSIDKGGNMEYPVYGDEGPHYTLALFGLWAVYKWYIWKLFGLHVYPPYLTQPRTLELSRKKPRKPTDQDPNPTSLRTVIDRTDHLRENFTWWFEYTGNDIESTPFTIRGSAQCGIDKTKIRNVQYVLESWCDTLDQALKSTIRQGVRDEATLEMVIGTTSPDLWGSSGNNTDFSGLSGKLMSRIRNFKFESTQNQDLASKTLAELGLPVYSLNITDFEDELLADDRRDLHAPARGKMRGRAAQLEKLGHNLGDHDRATKLGRTKLGPAIAQQEADVRAAEAGNFDNLINKLARWFGGD